MLDKVFAPKGMTPAYHPHEAATPQRPQRRRPINLYRLGMLDIQPPRRSTPVLGPRQSRAVGQVAASPQTVPKIVWMMWLQGLDNAPPAVKACYDSWVAHNPDWQVVMLDEHNFRDYVDVDDVLGSDNNMQIQARADVIRINLLAEHGGVWADATCFCRKPLDSWIDDYTRSGFFAFDKPSKLKLMDNWFMASHQGCYLTQRVADASNAYWLENTGLTRRHATMLARTLNLLLNRSITTTRHWFSPAIRKLTRSYPYPWFQYLFTRLVAEDARFRDVWAQTPKFSADLPHKLLRLGIISPLTEEAKREIDSETTPLYKLNWHYSPAKYTPDTTLHYLFSTIQDEPTPPHVLESSGQSGTATAS